MPRSTKRAIPFYTLVAVAILVTLLAFLLSPYRTSTSTFARAQFHAQRVTLGALSSLRVLPRAQAYLKANLDANILGRTIMGVAWPTHDIQVCWENPSPSVATEMQWTKDAVLKTWAAHSVLVFQGWGQCIAGQAGVHLFIADQAPEARGIGNELDGETDGVIMNFAMQVTPVPCRSFREGCIQTVAEHEFGHVIGLTHEDFNPGAPDVCVMNSSGPAGDEQLTPYDPQSIMGYCTLADGKPHSLSQGDIESVNILYHK